MNPMQVVPGALRDIVSRMNGHHRTCFCDLGPEGIHWFSSKGKRRIHVIAHVFRSCVKKED